MRSLSTATSNGGFYTVSAQITTPLVTYPEHPILNVLTASLVSQTSWM